MKISGLAKKLLLIICILAVLLIAGSVIYYRSSSCLPFVYGVVLGAAASVAKIIILDKTVDKALSMEKKAAGNLARLNHALRLLLTAGVLVLAAIVPGISIWGAAAGILTFQIAVYIQRYFIKK